MLRCQQNRAKRNANHVSGNTVGEISIADNNKQVTEESHL